MKVKLKQVEVDRIIDTIKEYINELIATYETPGVVKPDGHTLLIDENGTLSVNLNYVYNYMISHAIEFRKTFTKDDFHDNEWLATGIIGNMNNQLRDGSYLLQVTFSENNGIDETDIDSSLVFSGIVSWCGALLPNSEVADEIILHQTGNYSASLTEDNGEYTLYCKTKVNEVGFTELYIGDNQLKTLSSLGNGNRTVRFRFMPIALRNEINLDDTIVTTTGGSSTLYEPVINVFDIANFAYESSTTNKFKTAKKITLSGEVSGEDRSDGENGWNITTELSRTGVQPGTYGPNGNMNFSLTEDSNIIIPTITVDNKGRITSAGQNVLTIHKLEIDLSEFVPNLDRAGFNREGLAITTNALSSVPNTHYMAAPIINGVPYYETYNVAPNQTLLEKTNTNNFSINTNNLKSFINTYVTTDNTIKNYIKSTIDGIDLYSNGNGINIDSNKVISVKVDGNTIKFNNGTMYVDSSKLSVNTTVNVTDVINSFEGKLKYATTTYLVEAAGSVAESWYLPNPINKTFTINNTISNGTSTTNEGFKWAFGIGTAGNRVYHSAGQSTTDDYLLFAVLDTSASGGKTFKIVNCFGAFNDSSVFVYFNTHNPLGLNFNFTIIGF